MKLPLTILLASLAIACAAPASSGNSAEQCPAGQELVHGASGPHCIIPDDMVNVVANCRPIVCHLYAEKAIAEHSTGASWCAGACAAFCQDNVELEKYSLARIVADDPSFAPECIY